MPAAAQRLTMHPTAEHEDLDDALRRCGAGWDAAQAHGLLCGRLAVTGSAGGSEWMREVLEGSPADDSNRGECEMMLGTLLESSAQQLSERLSGFQPLLPDDAAPAEQRAEALAHWCEGFLHGLVSGAHSKELKARLASEPISGIIKDTLQITRATAGGEDSDETVETAYAELVEYVRTATQLVYEELAPWRSARGTGGAPDDRVH